MARLNPRAGARFARGLAIVTGFRLRHATDLVRSRQKLCEPKFVIKVAAPPTLNPDSCQLSCVAVVTFFIFSIHPPVASMRDAIAKMRCCPLLDVMQQCITLPVEISSETLACTDWRRTRLFQDQQCTASIRLLNAQRADQILFGVQTDVSSIGAAERTGGHEGASAKNKSVTGDNDGKQPRERCVAADFFVPCQHYPGRPSSLLFPPCPV